MAAKSSLSVYGAETTCSTFLKPLYFPEVERDLKCFYDENHDHPIPCMICTALFECKEGKLSREKFVEHSCREHKIVIHRVCDIASYRCYSQYWKARFKEVQDIGLLLPVIKTNPETPDPAEHFYLLSDATGEDKQLRQFLQRKRLDAILEVQERERQDTSFRQACLFCTEEFSGNRSSLFHHMLHFHSFSIGQPDNTVFVNEFLDTLRTKLTNLQCLYCERTYRDLPTLKDHMRKKQHRKINPKNRLYDKYYVINYLEIGKSWQEILEEDDKECFSESDEEEEDTGDTSVGGTPVVCLFCPVASNSLNKTTRHMQDVHQFDLQEVLIQLEGSFYSKVKVINYIRRQVYCNTCIYCQVKHGNSPQLLDHMNTSKHFILPQQSIWDQVQYLFPTYENDGMLCVLDSDV